MGQVQRYVGYVKEQQPAETQHTFGDTLERGTSQRAVGRLQFESDGIRHSGWIEHAALGVPTRGSHRASARVARAFTLAVVTGREFPPAPARSRTTTR